MSFKTVKVDYIDDKVYEQVLLTDKKEFEELGASTLAVMEVDVDYDTAELELIDSAVEYIYNKICEDELDDFDIERVDVCRVINDYVCELGESGELSDYVKEYTKTSYYVILPQSLRGLYFEEDTQPDHEADLEEIYAKYKDQIIKDIIGDRAQKEEEKRARQELEDKKNAIVSKAKADYFATEDTKERNKIVTNLKNVLEVNYNEKLTKDKIVLKYFSL